MGNVLFNAKHRMCKQNTHTHAHGGAENSLFQICLTITKPLPPIYLERMRVVIRVHKPAVVYKLVQLYSKNPREHLNLLL